MAKIHGTAGDDNRPGTNGDDIFNLTQGGSDTAVGFGGDDKFVMGAAFDPGDTLNGGDGFDTVVLRGEYSDPQVFTDTTIAAVEALRLEDGFDYDLVLANANVTAGARLNVYASGLGSGHALTFDGSAETNGHFNIFASAGDDTITGGARADRIHLTLGGEDTAHGGDGRDQIFAGGTLDPNDTIDGGGGSDTLYLSGDYSGGLTLDSHVASVETIVFGAGFDYSIAATSDEVAAGGLQIIDATALHPHKSIVFDASGETHTRLYFFAGEAATNSFTGSDQNDIFDLSGDRAGASVRASGGGGADIYVAGAASERFIVAGAADSTSTTHDTVIGLDADHDTFVVGAAVNSVITHNATVAKGDLDSDLQHAMSHHFGANSAEVVTFTGSDFTGETFLVVDADGNAGYTPGQDYVFDITGYTGTVTTDTFATTV